MSARSWGLGDQAPLLLLLLLLVSAQSQIKRVGGVQTADYPAQTGRAAARLPAFCSSLS